MTIDARYRERTAIVYVRQSTEEQVQRNVGSRQYQDGQRDHALRYGWSDARIEVIDEDLAMSGMTTERPGYQRLLRAIEAGTVGALFLSDLSRVNRHDVEMLRLLERLARHDVLLFIDGHPKDPNDSSQVLATKIEALMVGRESQMRVETMYRGRVAKARAGQAVSSPPAGYVTEFELRHGVPTRTGRWIKDPDPLVQECVAAIFATFRTERSLARTCRVLRTQDIKIPARRKGELFFRAATVDAVRRFIKHPAYAGVYVFGEKQRRRLLAGALPPPPTRLIGHPVERPDHHEPYIRPAEYAENQQLLARNRWPTALGPGAALLQGLMRCGRHGAMSVNYPSAGTKTRWVFQCHGESLHGGKHCSTVPGLIVEEAVVAAVLDHLQSPRIAEVRALWEAQAQAAKRGGAVRQAELRRVEATVEKAKRLYSACADEHGHVKTMLEQDLNAHLADLARLRAELASGENKADPVTMPAWDELEHLCGDVRHIWDAPTTDDQDRKQLLRIVVRAVVVESIDRERIRVTVQWADEGSTEIEMLRAMHFHGRIVAMRQSGLTVRQIVAWLNEAGARTQKGHPWSPDTVRQTLRRMKATTESNTPQVNRGSAG